MKIILAETAGFCFGVKRAVELAFQSPKVENTYTLGPIIHNDAVIKKLEQEKNIYTVDDLQDSKIQQVIIRSHGVGSEVYAQAKEKGIEVIDATCPYVKKIHRFVEDYTKKGYHILIIGNQEHPEIIGIIGWASNNYTVIKECSDFNQINLPKDKRYLVVAQTTYKREIVLQVVEALQEKKYIFEFKDTICKATKERQEEAALLANKVDVMIVIGSSYSSNTQKLFEICKEACEKTYCVEDEKKLQREWFEKEDCIGITAGASTPSYSIEAVVKALEKIDLK